MKLIILISTIDDGIKKIKNILKNPREDVIYIISHQHQNKKYKDIPKELIRKDIIISQIPGKGISKNRNNAISKVSDGICLIADDDISFISNSFDKIIEIFEKNHDLDVACFKIKTKNGEPEYKKYPKKSALIKSRLKRGYYISSIEIAFKTSSIKKNKIYFDENFGIGSDLMIGGEEKIFIKECVKKNLKVMFFPYYISKHSYFSTMKKLSKFNNKRIFLDGGVDAEIIGYLSIIKAFIKTIYFTPTLLRKFKNPLKYLNTRLHGIFYILKKNKE